MKIRWKSIAYFLPVFLILFSIFLLFPSKSYAIKYGHVKNVSEMNEPEINYQFGEPGHDPFGKVNTLTGSRDNLGSSSKASGKQENQGNQVTGKQHVFKWYYSYLAFVLNGFFSR